MAMTDDRSDVKPLTKRHLNDAKRRLVAFFGADKALEAVAPGDADEFRRHLRRTLGENTVRRMCGRAKQFFRVAQRKRLIRDNPFGDMAGCAVQANRSRDYFLSREPPPRFSMPAPMPNGDCCSRCRGSAGFDAPPST